MHFLTCDNVCFSSTETKRATENHLCSYVEETLHYRMKTTSNSRHCEEYSKNCDNPDFPFLQCKSVTRYVVSFIKCFVKVRLHQWALHIYLEIDIWSPTSAKIVAKHGGQWNAIIPWHVKPMIRTRRRTKGRDTQDAKP